MKQMTERGQKVINALALALESIAEDITNYPDSAQHYYEFYQAENFLRNLGDDVYETIATLPEIS